MIGAVIAIAIAIADPLANQIDGWTGSTLSINQKFMNEEKQDLC